MKIVYNESGDFMITFICGKVYEFSGEHVILENNGIGYYINFNHPEILTLGEVVTIFTYQHFRDDATVLYGLLIRLNWMFFKN